jgi:perosamine synthetase
MPKTRIQYSKPSITDLEISYAIDAATNGWGERCYDYINRFEEIFGQYIGVKYAIATSSCTGALHMGLASLGVGHGDQVILADTNWIASAAPITYLGATPIFVDIKPDTWCIDPKKVVEAITKKTKAIIAVHLYGNLCDMDELLAIGKQYGIPVIEDAAEAIGSTYHGKYAGTIGKFGVFSFHGTKTLTTGEGGMLVTNDLNLYETVLTLSNHGRTRGQTRQFWPEMVGFKYKMANIQAAIGCAQVERVDELVARKRKIFQSYYERLASLHGVSMNPQPIGTQNGFWMPTLVFAHETGITRDILKEAFVAENIDARVFFWPLSSLPPFKPNQKNLVAYEIPERAINLPSYFDMTEFEIERVAKVVRNIHATIAVD